MMLSNNTKSLPSSPHGEDIKQTLRRRRNNAKITYRNVVFPGNQYRDSTLGHQGGGVHRLLI